MRIKDCHMKWILFCSSFCKNFVFQSTLLLHWKFLFFVGNICFFSVLIWSHVCSINRWVSSSYLRIHGGIGAGYYYINCSSHVLLCPCQSLFFFFCCIIRFILYNINDILGAFNGPYLSFSHIIYASNHELYYN